MFFRGRQPEASIWRRFRSGTDGFSFAKEGEYFVAHVVANAERVVDLFHALADHLPPAIDVAIEDVRTGSAWTGEGIALPDVRDVIARLKLPLSTYGGVEFSVYTADDQLTIDHHLELHIYAVTDQWLYLLLGKGLEERELVRQRSWRLRRDELAPAPELSSAISAAADRLALPRAETWRPPRAEADDGADAASRSGGGTESE
jgi:hypothetical protein